MNTMQNELLEQNLSREELQALRNRRTGMTIFQLSWIMAFVCLILVNWQLRFSYTEWPPAGVERLGVVLPTIGTLSLLLSVFFARRGLVAIRSDARAAFLTQWGVTLALGAAFVLIMIYEWAIAPVGTQYGAIFRLMTAFHGIHAVAIGVYMAYVYRAAQTGHYGTFDFWAVEAGAKLWYFVAFAWIMFYAVLYWI
jgi:heme/copper-type cytochrome/quinol oxidase subunit 3